MVTSVVAGPSLGPLDTVIDSLEHFFLALGSSSDPNDSSYHADSSVSFSWYISPRQHAIEFFLVNAAVIPLLFWLAFRCPRRVAPQMLAVSFDKQSLAVKALDFVVHFTGLITLGFTLWYKYEKKGMVFMLQPCHISNVLMMYFWFFPGASTDKNGKVRYNHFANHVHAFNMDIWFGSFAALLMPDFRNTVLFLEKEMFIIQHALLVALPFYYTAVRRYAVYSDAAHIAFNYLLFLLMHFDVFSVVGVATSSNINYMSQPPKGFDSFGHMYRVAVSLICIGSTALARYGFSGLWARMVRGVYPYTLGCSHDGTIVASEVRGELSPSEREKHE